MGNIGGTWRPCLWELVCDFDVANQRPSTCFAFLCRLLNGPIAHVLGVDFPSTLLTALESGPAGSPEGQNTNPQPMVRSDPPPMGTTTHHRLETISHEHVRLVSARQTLLVFGGGGYNFCFDPQLGQLPHRSLAPGIFPGAATASSPKGPRASSNFLCNPLRGWTNKSCHVPGSFECRKCGWAGYGEEEETGNHGVVWTENHHDPMLMLLHYELSWSTAHYSGTDCLPTTPHPFFPGGRSWSQPAEGFWRGFGPMLCYCWLVLGGGQRLPNSGDQRPRGQNR